MQHSSIHHRTSRAAILVVEDDDAIAEMVVELLIHAIGAEVARVSTAGEAIQWCLERTPDLILIDVLLPDGNGLDLTRVVRQDHDFPVCLMTGQPSMGRAIEALRLGVDDLFTKPFDLQRLAAVVQRLLAQQQTARRQRRRSDRLEKLARRVLAERRELRQRVELVCRDLVASYHDLAERFARERRLKSEGPS